MEIALLGNPNTGKTSLFNHLTGSYEYVGNWSGVTIEKKVGVFKNKKANLVDLPGAYSLNPLSADEAVVTEYLLQDEFEKIVNIVDASQLRRNLLLTLQLIEYEKPVVIGLNMMDVATGYGKKIKIEALLNMLGCPVVAISARKGEGCTVLADAVTNHTNTSLLKVDYGKMIEQYICEMSSLVNQKTNLSARWLTLQLIEGNASVLKHLHSLAGKMEVDDFLKRIEAAANKIGKEAAQLVFEARRNVVEDILASAEIMEEMNKEVLTNKVDRMVTNKYLGLPIFMLLMYFMFMLTFDWFGSKLSDLVDRFITGFFTNIISTALGALNVSPFIETLVMDGIIAGVGGVLVFVPQIFILFFCLSFLEDSGYMSRVALVVDKLMEKSGLNGKAVIPMIIGFGCNVPGVMAARTIETKRERLLTIILLPFMSCSARFPVYALFIGAFFAKNGALIVLSIYLLSIFLVLILAKLLSATILKGEKSLFIIELPPYRMPSIKILWKSTWDKGKGFLKKAGTFIFAGSVVIWLLTYFGPAGMNVEMDNSYLASIGELISPLLKPLGFGTWQAGASLLTGFLAKEAVVSAMNIIYAVPNIHSLQHLMSEVYTPLASYSFMVFILLYIPCLATLATIYKETASKKWSAFSIVYSLMLAYGISFIIYQVGRLFGLT
ncbi:ferrous iron transport protein B [Niallia nealsonii]|uniref:Ferrous iron transport protein B n=1 Tax=Niallia nealsonii TaxID=115979 RepID=A0A2N0Z7C8_9BACI|nr:ferrous iron transport protein B [Niallia nealsonii]PKG25411.1 ferrous iron transport protein B [Niallia nealsonii]